MGIGSKARRPRPDIVRPYEEQRLVGSGRRSQRDRRVVGHVGLRATTATNVPEEVVDRRLRIGSPDLGRHAGIECLGEAPLCPRDQRQQLEPGAVDGGPQVGRVIRFRLSR
jgi:hypothetical protein